MYVVYKAIIKNTGRRPGLCRHKALSTLRHLAIPSAAVGFYPPSLASALVVGGICPLLLVFCPPSLCVINGRNTLQWVVDTCGCWMVCVEGREKLNHNFRHDSPYQRQVSTVMVGLDVSAGRWEERLEKTNTTFIMFIFVMHWLGLPLFLSLPKSGVKRERAARTPLERGGWVRWLGPLVIVMWFVMLTLGRGVDHCWVGYVIVMLNSLSLGLVCVVAPYLPLLS